MVLTNPTITSVFSPFFTLPLQLLSDVFGLFQSLLLEHKCDSVIPILKHPTFNYTLVFHFNSSLIYFLLTISIPRLAFLWICSKQDKWLHLTLESQKHHSVPTALSNTSIIRDHADTPEMSSFLSPSPLAFFWQFFDIILGGFSSQILARLHKHNDFGLLFFLP